MRTKIVSISRYILGYFKKGMFEVHFFWLLGFSEKYYTAYKIISSTKKRSRNTWLLNNLFFPLCVILIPFLFKIIHDAYDTIDFNKSFINILIGGSLSLSGINVLRTSTTINPEKLSHDKIPSEYIAKISEIESEINIIKKRLISWSWVLSIVGSVLYWIQIAQLINDSNNIVYWFLLGIISTFLLSLFFGRFISLMETNLFEREDYTKLLFSKLITQNNDLNDLEAQLKEKGLL